MMRIGLLVGGAIQVPQLQLKCWIPKADRTVQIKMYYTYSSVGSYAAVSSVFRKFIDDIYNS